MDFNKFPCATTQSDARACARNAKEDMDLKKRLTILNREKEYQRKLLELDIKVVKNKINNSKDRMRRCKSTAPTRNSLERRILTHRRNTIGLIPFDENGRKLRFDKSINQGSFKFDDNHGSKLDINSNCVFPFDLKHSHDLKKNAIARAGVADNHIDMIGNIANLSLASSTSKNHDVPESCQSPRISDNDAATANNDQQDFEPKRVTTNKTRKLPKNTFRVRSMTTSQLNEGFNQTSELFSKREVIKTLSSPVMGRNYKRPEGAREKLNLSPNMAEFHDGLSKSLASPTLLSRRASKNNKKEFLQFAKNSQQVGVSKLTKGRSYSLPHFDALSTFSEHKRNIKADALANYISTRMPLITNANESSAKRLEVANKYEADCIKESDNDAEEDSEICIGDRDCCSHINTNRIRPVNAWSKSDNETEEQMLSKPDFEADNLLKTSCDAGNLLKTDCGSLSSPDYEAGSLVPLQDVPFKRPRSNTECCLTETMWDNIEQIFKTNDEHSSLIMALVGKEKLHEGLSLAELEDIKHCRYIRLPKYLENANQSTENCCIFHKSGCDIKSFYHVQNTN